MITRYDNKYCTVADCWSRTSRPSFCWRWTPTLWLPFLTLGGLFPWRVLWLLSHSLTWRGTRCVVFDCRRWRRHRQVLQYLLRACLLHCLVPYLLVKIHLRDAAVWVF